MFDERFGTTPFDLVQRVGDLLIPPAQGRPVLLDPCCGEGDVIVLLAGILNLRRNLGPGDPLGRDALVYGVEIDRAKSAVAKTASAFTQVLRTDAMSGVRWAPRTYDLVWLHPWIDRPASQFTLRESTPRQEIFIRQFLTLGRPVRAEGVLALICPPESLKALTPLLLKDFEGGVLPVGSESSDPVRQALPLVFALPDLGDGIPRHLFLGAQRPRRKGWLGEGVLDAFTARIDSAPPLIVSAVRERFPLPGRPAKSTLPPLVCTVTDPESAIGVVREQGWSTVAKFTRQLWSPPPSRVRTARPLNPGHLGVAVAAGMVDNLILDSRPEGGSVVAVKGVTVKTEQDLGLEEQPDGSRIRRVTETFTSTVQTLDLFDGSVWSYDINGPSRDAGE